MLDQTVLKGGSSLQDTERVSVVGAGPVGMITALELARNGIPSRILEKNAGLNTAGSRGIVIHRTALEVMERVHAHEILERGLYPEGRKTYFGDTELFGGDFPRPAEGELPMFINLQQYTTERVLYEAILQQRDLIDFCWQHEVRAVEQDEASVKLQVAGPDSVSTVESPYVVASDGCRSPMRKMLNMDFPGFTDQSSFLITDIKAELPHRPEHRFTFAPSHGQSQTQLIVPQPEGVWRLDWQLFPDQQGDDEMDESRMKERIRKTIGEDVPFEIVWQSCYRFHQRMMESFQNGRVFFAGDAAHLVAPFGARGMNSGIQDAENIAWKIAAVLQEESPSCLLNTYNRERMAAARENQDVTISSMRFISPDDSFQGERDSILRQSACDPSVRCQVDSGKMCTAYQYADSPLSHGNHALVGARAPDVSLGSEGHLRHMIGDENVVLTFTESADDWFEISPSSAMIAIAQTGRCNDRAIVDGGIRAKFDVKTGDSVVIRPDGHIGAVCATNEVECALETVLGHKLA